MTGLHVEDQLETRGARLQAIQGTVPPLGQLPPGCSFAPRCPSRFEPCDKAVPGVTGGAHAARCYLYSPAVDPAVTPEERK